MDSYQNEKCRQEEIRLNLKELFLKKAIMRHEHPSKVGFIFSELFTLKMANFGAYNFSQFLKESLQ